MLSTQLIISNHPVILSHQLSVTVSLETNPLYPSMENMHTDSRVLRVNTLFFVLFKGAERKNKDESKSAEKRIQKWVKQNTSSCAG